MTLDELVRLRRVRDLVDREYAEPLDVPALARVALMSAGHFSRSFRAAFGETPYGYVMTRRIERAKALLRRGDLSVTEVCFAVGCTSLGSFSSRFTELVGESPSVYRARSHEAGAAVPPCIAKIFTRPTRPVRSVRRDAGKAAAASAGAAAAARTGSADADADAGAGAAAAGPAARLE
ncbi:helix-turn-helix transcriptional regulator, partial [Streptomyces benahoarensis]